MLCVRSYPFLERPLERKRHFSWMWSIWNFTQRPCSNRRFKRHAWHNCDDFNVSVGKHFVRLVCPQRDLRCRFPNNVKCCLCFVETTFQVMHPFAHRTHLWDEFKVIQHQEPFHRRKGYNLFGTNHCVCCFFLLDGSSFSFFFKKKTQKRENKMTIRCWFLFGIVCTLFFQFGFKSFLFTLLSWQQDSHDVGQYASLRKQTNK